MPSMASVGLIETVLGHVLPAPVRLSGALLVVANAVPLYGVLVWDWPVFHVMVLYWAENVIAGVVTLLRMLRVNLLGGLLMGAFFCFHYGMFCFVHGIFVNSLFNPDKGGAAAFGVEPLAWAILTTPTLLAAAALLAASHVGSFVAHVLAVPADADKLGEVMARPYKRMVALHIALIFGGWAIMGFEAPVAAVAILIVIKTAIDLGLHARINLPRADPATAAPEPAP